MELIFPAAFAAILYYFYQNGEEFAKALGKSLLIFETFVVLFANVLSIGNHLSRRMSFAAWAMVFAIFVFLGIKKHK